MNPICEPKHKLAINFSLGKRLLLACGWGALGIGLLFTASGRAADNGPVVSRPNLNWLTDLGLGLKESYDDNLLQISGRGLKPQASWITGISPRLGFNFAPLLGNQPTFQTLSLSYTPEFNLYHNAPSESYNAHRIADVIKGQNGPLSFLLDNAFLFNDGNATAPTFALNQLAGAAANQNDKFRSFYAAMARERRRQIQDRTSAWLQYDLGRFFVRPTASLLDYDLRTDFHNASFAPYIGYQNFADRSDVNGGADAGFKFLRQMAVTLGYRYGQQHQEQFPAEINSDRHFSSSDYQRVLLGLEGKPWDWLTIKMAGGPDFRSYNPMAAVSDLHPVTYYAEATLTATLTPNQTLEFNYRQWRWLSATGLVPLFDSSYALTYRGKVGRDWTLDLQGRIAEADFTVGNDVAGSGPSLRDDLQYSVSAGVTYAFDVHWMANLSYTCYLGRNALDGLPATLAPDYRSFDQNVIFFRVQYKF